uniref:Uncharacterized protein n=1 Tax=Opuntia streptacantha TaxID=393608 RepID=A0A7C8ZXY0_OPUST
MVHKQELHHPFPSLLGQRCVCLYLHSRKSRHGARSDRFGRFLDLNQTHTTISSNREATVVAKTGNINPGDLTRLKNGETLRDFDGVPIDKDFDCIFRIGEMNPSVTDWWARRRRWRIWGGLHRCSFWVFEFWG